MSLRFVPNPVIYFSKGQTGRIIIIVVVVFVFVKL